MKKKVIKFSIEKYRKWCKKNKEMEHSWADECINQNVTEWNGERGFCKGYVIIREWVVIRYE